jgi:hypothetical protein
MCSGSCGKRRLRLESRKGELAALYYAIRSVRSNSRSKSLLLSKSRLYRLNNNT